MSAHSRPPGGGGGSAGGPLPRTLTRPEARLAGPDTPPVRTRTNGEPRPMTGTASFARTVRTAGSAGTAGARDPRSFDHLPARYDRYAELAGDELHAWLSFHLPVGQRGSWVGRALDAGCATGTHTELLAGRANEVLAVDRSAPMIYHARSRRGRGNVRYEVADLLHLTRAEVGRFDVVVCTHTVHYLDDLTSALLHLRGLTRPGGRVLLADIVDDRRAVSRSWLRAQAWRTFRDDLLRHRRPLAEAAELLRLQLDPDWLEHQAGDRLCPAAEWDTAALSVFPGAALTQLGRTRALSWQAPDPDTRDTRDAHPTAHAGGGR